MLEEVEFEVVEDWEERAFNRDDLSMGIKGYVCRYVERCNIACKVYSAVSEVEERCESLMLIEGLRTI